MTSHLSIAFACFALLSSLLSKAVDAEAATGNAKEPEEKQCKYTLAWDSAVPLISRAPMTNQPHLSDSRRSSVHSRQAAFFSLNRP
jgi:hypothetical protein